MTNRERFDRAVGFQPVDRIVTYDLLMNEQILAECGGADGDILRRNARMCRSIGLDATRSVFDPANHWLVAKVAAWTSLLGADRSEWGVAAGGGTAWIARRPFNDFAGLAKHLPRMPDRAAVAEWYEPTLVRIKEAFDAEDVVFLGATEGPFTDIYNWMGTELMCLSTYEAPELLAECLKVTTAWGRTLAELYAANPTSGAFFVCDDIACKAGLMFRPDYLRQELIPRLRHIIEPIKSAGLKAFFHSDGNIGEITDDLVNLCGFDGLNPIEPIAGMDIVELRRRYPRTVLLGNIDCSQLPPYGSEAEIAAEVHRVIDGAYPGLLLGSSSEIHPAVPPANAAAMYRAAHEHSLPDADLS